MSINEKDMSFFFFYKRRASFYQGNLNFVTTNEVQVRLTAQFAGFAGVQVVCCFAKKSFGKKVSCEVVRTQKK
jgi:hypothetical protein